MSEVSDIMLFVHHLIYDVLDENTGWKIFLPPEQLSDQPGIYKNPLAEVPTKDCHNIQLTLIALKTNLKQKGDSFKGENSSPFTFQWT